MKPKLAKETAWSNQKTKKQHFDMIEYVVFVKKQKKSNLT
jgi:hypothetical protein